MQKICKKHLKWTDDEYDKYTKDLGPLEAADKIIRHAQMPSFVKDACRKERIMILLAERGCPPLPDKAEPSLLELQVMTTVNPFYGQFVFGMSHDACVTMGKLLDGVNVPKPMVAHAVLMEFLKNSHGQISLEEARKSFSERGLDPELLDLVATLEPYGPDPLRGHELRHYADIDTVAPAMVKVSHDALRTSLVRERKNLVNQIKFHKGKFTLFTKENRLGEMLGMMANKKVKRSQ